MSDDVIDDVNDKVSSEKTELAPTGDSGLAGIGIGMIGLVAAAGGLAVSSVAKRKARRR